MKTNRKKSILHQSQFTFWIVGFFAFLWIIVRSGMNPKRLTYPCQQALYPIASSWLIALLALVGGSYVLKKYAKLTAGGIIFISIGYLIFVFFDSSVANDMTASFQNNQQAVQVDLPVWEVTNPVSKVFALNNIPPTSGSLNAADATVPNAYLSDPAMDTLFLVMQMQGIYLHKTVNHTDGIVGSDNIVIIKGNFQWDSQCATNTDRIKGLINQILNHPDGFNGEIIVCDNTQNLGSGINDRDNNSDDPNQSIADVVNTFYAKGYPVYLMNWNTMYNAVANEYSQNDMNNGYIYEDSTKISYPKFRTPSGNYYVSLRYGTWDNDSRSYNHDKLCIIDFPVLKAHSVAGATIAVKNWVGVLTTAYSTERYGGFWPMHNNYFFGPYALIAKVMAVTYPKLCIVDAAWTDTRVGNDLNAVVKTDCLLASTDPVAVDWYSAKYILTPVAQSPQSTNPDAAGGTFNTNLRYWADYLKSQAGFPVTMNANEISVYDRSVLSNPTGVESDNQDIQSKFILNPAYPNPFNSSTTISYSLNSASFVELSIYNLKGQLVDCICKQEQNAGHHSYKWNPNSISTGIYFIKLTADNFTDSRRCIYLK